MSEDWEAFAHFANSLSRSLSQGLPLDRQRFLFHHRTIAKGVFYGSITFSAEYLPH